MALTVGKKIWIPCRVRPGPFSDERMVLVETDDDTWFGYVNERWLQNKVETGSDQVLGTVVDVKGDTFAARIPGPTPQSGLFHGSIHRARPLPRGSLEA